jgi:hypothetical protein
LSHLQGLRYLRKVGHTPKIDEGYNPRTFKQHYDHGGSLQLHKIQFANTSSVHCALQPRQILKMWTSENTLKLTEDLHSEAAKHYKEEELFLDK